MPNRHTTLTGLFDDIADAIRSKGVGSTDGDLKADDFDTSIGSIVTLTEGTSGKTATSDDLLSGKTAYSWEGNSSTGHPVAITGNIPSKVADTYDVSTSDQEIASGQYLSGKQTFRGVTTSNISAGNIKCDITVKVGDAAKDDRIKGVKGTFSGSNTITGDGVTAATGDDILKNKAAFLDGSQITGSMETVSASITGGAITGSTSISGNDNVTLSTTDNGIAVSSSGSANRAKITYGANISGYISKSNGDDITGGAAPSDATPIDGSTKYITGVTVPKDKGFTVTTTADTALDTTSDLDVTNNAYRRVDINNKANGTVLVSNSGTTNVTSGISGTTTQGTITVNAYPATGTTLTGAKTVVSGGRWSAVSANTVGTHYYGGDVTIASSITLPKDVGLAVTTTADTALDTTSDLDVTNNAYRRIDINNKANGTVLVSNAGTTTVSSNSGTTNVTSGISGTTTQGTITVNAYPATGTTLTGAKTVVSGGRWSHNNASALGTNYYGETSIASTVNVGQNQSLTLNSTGASGKTASVTVNNNAYSTTAVTSGDSSTGTVTVNAYNNASTSALTGAQTVVSGGKWNYKTIAAADTVYYGAVSASSGSATTPATTVPVDTSSGISWDASTKTITVSKSDTKDVTPSVSAGYVSAGTVGTITASASGSKTLTNAQLAAADSNIAAGNIKTGVTILGVEGTYTSDGDAKNADILYGKIAYADGNKRTGSMTNQGAVTGTISSNGGTYTIPAGYHNGSGVVTASIPNIASTVVSNNFTAYQEFTANSNVTSSTSISSMPEDGSIRVVGGIAATSGIIGSQVYNAVWNDLADAIPVDDTCDLEYGYCYCFDGEHYYKSSKYLDDGIIGIHSDTAGFVMGTKGIGKEMQVAVAGFVLAYVDKEYLPGTLLTCTENGWLTEISKQDKIENPEKIVASFWKPEVKESWGSPERQVKVNGRMWVKIR